MTHIRVFGEENESVISRAKKTLRKNENIWINGEREQDTILSPPGEQEIQQLIDGCPTGGRRGTIKQQVRS